MREQPVIFYRLIPGVANFKDASVDFPPSELDTQPENMRKVTAWWRYKDYRRTLAESIFGEVPKEDIHEFGKIYCKTLELCENQICTERLFYPKCPFARYVDLKVDKRKQKQYLLIRKELSLEMWEICGGHDSKWIDMLKIYYKVPMKEVPPLDRKNMLQWFYDLQPKTRAYNFWRSKFPDFLNAVEVQKKQEESAEKVQELREYQVVYRIVDMYFIDFQHLGRLEEWTMPRHYHSRKPVEWEQYKMLEELPKGAGGEDYVANRERWPAYRAIRLFEEQFCLAPLVKGFSSFNRLLIKQEGLRPLKDLITFVVNWLGEQEKTWEDRRKWFFRDTYGKEEEFDFEVNRLLDRIEEILGERKGKRIRAART
jgi:hypothetical protein